MWGLHLARELGELKTYLFKETNERPSVLNIYFNEKKAHLDEEGEEKASLCSADVLYDHVCLI